MNHLKSIEVKQLGKVENLKLNSLSPSLNVIFGRNESGKSTLRNSIRFALYGFPAKLKTNQNPDRQNANYYSPTYPSRNIVGSITDGTRDYSFTQSDSKGAKTSSPSFSENAGLELLEHMLSDVESQEYRTVFNVTAEEMASIDQATSDSYVSRFLASAFGTDKNPNDVRASLEEAISNHAKSGQAIKVSVAKAAKAYTAAQSVLTDARSKAERAGDARARQIEAEQELSRLSEKSALANLKIRESEECLRKAKQYSELIDQLDSDIKALNAQLEQKRRDREAVPYADALAIKSMSSDIMALSDDASRIEEYKKKLIITRSEMNEAEQKRQRLGKLPSLDNRQDLETLKSQSRSLNEDINIAKAKLSAAEDQRTHIPSQPQDRVSGLALALFIAGIGGLAAGIFFLAYNASLAPGLAALVASVGFLLAGLRVQKSNRSSTSVEEIKSPFITQAELRLKEAQDAWEDFTSKNFPDYNHLNALELDGLFEKLDEAFQLNTRILDLKNTEASLNSEVTHHSSKYASLAQELVSNSLFTVGNLRDALHAANTAHQEAVSLDKEIASKSSELLSLEEQRKEAIGNLSGIESTEALSEKLTSMQEERDLLGNRINQLTDELGGIKQTIKFIGADRAVEQARAELEATRTAAIEAVKNLAKQQIALDLLTASMKEYSRTEAPNIMELSSQIFNRITEKEYASITLNSEDGLRVKDKDARTLKPYELSSGTADQLYLSIRLGMLSSLKERGKDLPVVLDDILSSFDAERRTLAIREIVALSKNRQVILTTHDGQIFSEILAQAKQAQTYVL